MNRKFRRKRLTLNTGVDHPNSNSFLNQFKSLRENINNRPQFLFYRWLLILLCLGPFISLFKSYVNSQTATDSNVNTFFHSNNGHFLESDLTNTFPNLATQTDQLVTSNNQKQQTSINQRNQLINNHKIANTSPIPNSNNELSNTNNKNRSSRTNRNDNRRLKLNESKKQNNLTDSLSSSSSSSLSSSLLTVQSSNQTTNKQSNIEKSKQIETKNVNSNLNESKTKSRTVVAGNISPEKSDLNLEEIAEESLKVESSIGASSVEYITEEEEKRIGNHATDQTGEEAVVSSSNDLLNTGYKLNIENENSPENKDVYTDSQGEFLFNHQQLPHKMQYETEIQRLDGKCALF